MLSRRNFVKTGGLMTMAGAFAPSFLAQTLLAAPTGLSDKPRALVVIQLGGGNDGLNTLVPFTDEAYYKVRPTIGIKPDTLLKLDDNFGLSPSMKAFKSFWDNGQLAVVRGVGYPNPNYSHFRSMEIWQSGQPEGTVKNGWLGRYLETLPKEQAGKIGMAVGNAGQGGGAPLAFWTEYTQVLSYNGPEQFQLQGVANLKGDKEAQIAAARKIFALSNDPNNALPDYVRATALDALNASDQLAKVATNYKPAVTYPAGQFASRLKSVAQLLGSDYGARVFFVPTDGSFDTHFNEGLTHDRLIGAVTEPLGAFYQDLEAHGLADSVLTVTFSEFGRRVAENGSKGTDHGSAAPMFIIGGKNAVKPGLYGQQPSLTDLDNGNMKSSTDFRSVYGTVVKNWLGSDPAKVVGGEFPLLDFLK